MNSSEEQNDFASDFKEKQTKKSRKLQFDLQKIMIFVQYARYSCKKPRISVEIWGLINPKIKSILYKKQPKA